MRNDRSLHSQRKSSTAETKSRKDLRKEKKVQKKEKKRLYFQNRSQHRNDPNTRKPQSTQQMPKNNTNKLPNNTNKLPNNTKTLPNITKKVVPKQKEASKIQPSKKTIKRKQQIETQDDKMIHLYEQKLGFAEGKDKYGKIAKKFGFDDDIFDFLDGITKKVQNTEQYQQQQNVQQVSGEDAQIQDQSFDEERQGGYMEEQEQGQELGQADLQDQQHVYQNLQDNGDFDEEYDRMFNQLDYIQPGMQEVQSQKYIFQEANTKSKQYKKQASSEQEQRKSGKLTQQVILQAQKHKERPKFLGKDNEENPQKIQLKKSMNSLFNKLSDGNVLLTFRQLVQTIQSNPKSLVIPIFADLFAKFNLMIEKPLFHILATNVALLAALHYAVGNRFIAPVLQTLTQKYIELNGQIQNELQVSQLGYSKRFERIKNYATIVSLLYNYGSITGQFIETYVGWLVQKMDKSNVELIYTVIQKCGMHIRHRDPSALKTVISLVKGAIEVLKKQPLESDEQQQKVNFIELQLNEIRFNKKSQNAIDQRMAFLQTFINKNVRKEIERQKQVFPLTFQALKNIRSQQLSRTIWWETDQGTQNMKEEDQDNQQHQINQVVKQKNRLLELAKSFHMVTQTKRSIFVCLMDSKDYLEATQRILELKIKNMQEVATVLVEVCTLQPNFNPYYPFVAAKIASLIPKFRLYLQYAIWDHLKLIRQYQLRRTSNLAKFTAKVIAQPMANCSMSLLKFYPDLSNVEAIDRTFLDIFFGYFLKKVKKEYLSKLVHKLRQDNNRDVKLGIQQYLSEFESEKSIHEKLQICRRLLAIELDQRKMERNDENNE